MKTNPAAVKVQMVAVSDNAAEERCDDVAAEEPLEIRIVTNTDGRPQRHSVAVTMRTPGHDFELAAGFLFSEGIVSDPSAVCKIAYCGATAGASQHNVVNVFLDRGVDFDPSQFSRNVYTTSSCGVCGKTSLEMVRVACSRQPVGSFCLSADYFSSLPEQLSAAQDLFARTGGMHAAGLFDTQGRLLMVREDVGRHNALDKLIGTLFVDNNLPASDRVLLVSGRTSYELVQKAVMAGIPALAAVGAPSSLAIDIAQEFNLTLVGFLRNRRFNVYSGRERITSCQRVPTAEGA